jgi:hypothetical protein
MALFKILSPFKFAHGGIQVEEFAPSPDPVELTEECAAVALAEKWVKLAATPRGTGDAGKDAAVAPT